MNNKFRVILKDNFLPAQIFFNAIPDRSFVKTLRAFSDATGGGFNDAFCAFPGEEDFDEEPLPGIQFSIKDEETIVSYDDFLSILENACKVYCESKPEEKEIIYNLFSDIENKVNSLKTNNKP